MTYPNQQIDTAVACLVDDLRRWPDGGAELTQYLIDFQLPNEEAQRICLDLIHLLRAVHEANRSPLLSI